MNPMRVMRNKQIRGHLLYLLQLSGTATTERALELGMISSLMVTNPDISEYLNYLLDRRYIEKVKSAEFGVEYYKITADGVDILEGSRSDPGVIVGARE